MIAPIPLAMVLRRAVRRELAILYAFAAAMMGLAVIMSLSRGGMISLVAGLMFVVAFGFKSSSAEEPGVTNRDVELKGQEGEESPSFVSTSPCLLVYQASSRFPYVASRIAAIIVMFFTIGAGVLWIGADSVVRRFERSELAQSSIDADNQGETFFQSRGWIWRDTAAMIRDKWAMGVGLGAYRTAYPIYDSHDGSLVVEQAHNDYLQVASDGGIFGAVIALWFLFLLTRDIARALRHKSHVLSATALGVGGGIFALLVHSFFDFNFQIPSNAMLFLVLASVVSQIASGATGEPRGASRASLAAGARKGRDFIKRLNETVYKKWRL
jgi:O-antigen ligase